MRMDVGCYSAETIGESLLYPQLLQPNELDSINETLQFVHFKRDINEYRNAIGYSLQCIYLRISRNKLNKMFAIFDRVRTTARVDE